MSELPDETDDFFEMLSPLLEEDAAPSNDDPSSRATEDILSLLLDENVRLRALTVMLSNLLGDLPVRDWEDAVVTVGPAVRVHARDDAASGSSTSAPSA